MVLPLSSECQIIQLCAQEVQISTRPETMTASDSQDGHFTRCVVRDSWCRWNRDVPAQNPYSSFFVAHSWQPTRNGQRAQSAVISDGTSTGASSS